MKKFLSLVLALVMTMSLVTISAGAKDFTDESDVNYDTALAVISTLKIVEGYPDGSFKPAKTLTRAEAAKIICNMILTPTTAAALSADTAPFSDVPTTHWAAGYIAYCAQQEIINGYGNGAFGPSDTLTGYQFMKMLLTALGYDAAIEGYVGGNWSIPVAKQALYIGLDKGNDDFDGNLPVTREEACLYAFNALKADMVEYKDKSNIIIGDISIVTSANASETGKTFMETYFPKLKAVKNSEDAFGRPATDWIYKNEDICTEVDEADASYTKAVKEKDLYKDLGITAENKFDIYEDGDKIESDFVVGKDTSDTIGGNGILVEAFYSNDKGADNRIVIINTYVEEIVDIDENDDDERVVVVSGKHTYQTEEFEEDDVVLVTKDVTESDKEADIKSMALTEKETGKLTKKAGLKYTIDGEVYELSESAGADIDAVSTGKNVDFYLDAYGYIISLAEAETSVSVEEVALVLDVGTDRGEGWAKLMFTDGKIKTVDTKDVISNNDIGALVSFEVKDGIYDCDVLDDEDGAVYDSGIDFEKGEPWMDIGTGDARGSLKADSKSVYVVATADDEDDYNANKFDVETYTGYKKAPDMSGVADVAALTDDNGMVSVIFVLSYDADLLNTSAALTFVAGNKDADMVDEDKVGKYYEFQAIVEGELQTIKVDATLIDDPDFDVAVLKNTSYTSKDIMDSYETAEVWVEFGAFTAVEVKNDVLLLDGDTYAWADDVKVFEIDGEDITDGLKIDDIKKDNDDTKNPYDAILVTLNEKGKVDMIVLVLD